MDSWHLTASVAANATSFLACTVFSGCLVWFWVDKHKVLPYSLSLLGIASWIFLCGMTRLLDAVGSVHEYSPSFLTVIVVLDMFRAVLGIVSVIFVPLGIYELTKYAPPKQMQASLKAMAHCIADLSERESDGQPPQDRTTTRITSVGTNPTGDSVSPIYPVLRLRNKRTA